MVLSRAMDISKNGKFLLISLIAIVISGCASISPRNPLPEQYVEHAEIPSVPGARFFADEMEVFWAKKIEAIEEGDVEHAFVGLKHKPHSYLAISGGGENGAFGAGVLNGWTASGNRPEFTLVTGISTGALIAPYAFLGTDYDAQLKKAFTTFSTADLAKRQSVFYILAGDSVISTELLLEHIRKLFDQSVLDAIGVEHLKGRRLFIGTFNMDAGRPVIWDIGEIAVSNYLGSLDLFHRVLLASASIPGAFPPVRFHVEAEGRIYDELHADGGVATQVFLYPTTVNWKRVEELLDIQGRPKAYVIRNSFLQPEWKPVEQKMFPLLGRSIDSLIRTQGLGDLNTIFLLAKRDGIEFNLTYIPSTFTVESKEQFDMAYMKALFDVGYEMGLSESFWKKAPPGFEDLAGKELKID